MTFEKKYLIKNAFLFCLVMLLVVLLVFFTYSLNERNFSRKLLTNVLTVDEDAYGDLKFDSGVLNMVPILDTSIFSSKNVMHIKFKVGGGEENTSDKVIYDIALVDLNVSCELLSPYLKWKLIKNNTEEFNGSFDYKFDTIKNGRLVLTDIQQDLVPFNKDKNVYDQYDFYMWLSDSCQEEDITLCKNKMNQDGLMDKILKGRIEVELYGEGKETLVRKPSDSLDNSTCLVSE